MYTLIKRNIKKSFFIIIIFFVISFFISIGTSNIEKARRNAIELNKFLSNNSISFNISNAYKISTTNFFKTVQEESNIILEKEISTSNFNGKAIYFDKSDLGHPQLISGRYFENSDFQSNYPLAVIGKDVEKYVTIKNGIKYLQYNDIDYKVIGIMGYYGESSVYDSKVFLNLNSLLQGYKTLETLDTGWTIDSISNNNDYVAMIYANIDSKLKKINSDILLQQVYVERNLNPLNEAIRNEKTSIVIVFLVLGVLFLNIVTITSHWIDSQRKEIGVRIALGSSNQKLFLRILAHYQLIALLSTIFGILTHFIFIRLRLLGNLTDGIYAINILISILVMLFVGLLTASISMKHIFKFQANDIMKGR